MDKFCRGREQIARVWAMEDRDVQAARNRCVPGFSTIHGLLEHIASIQSYPLLNFKV